MALEATHHASLASKNVLKEGKINHRALHCGKFSLGKTCPDLIIPLEDLLMKFLLFLLIVLQLAIFPSFAQDHPSITAHRNSVYVGPNVKYEAAPNTAVIQFTTS